MRILHLFSGYNNFTLQAHLRNIEVVSVDIKSYKNCPAPSFQVDFMDFDFRQFAFDEFDFILIGFPCTTFSKASGGYHFKSGIPITTAATKSLLMIDRLCDLLAYFFADWMIENPTSALFSNVYFRSRFPVSYYNLIRTHQRNYGHVLLKQTDLLTSKDNLWISPRQYRVNGKVSNLTMDKLPLRVRQSYPPAFCDAIIDYILL